jgi:hypothetical protein
MSDSAFWFVWNTDGHAPRHQHATLFSAENEAQRLARENRSHTFIVLQSVSAYTVDDMVKVDLRPAPF